MILLVSAGLLGKSFYQLLQIDPGFRTESAVAMELSLPNGREDETRYKKLMEAFTRSIPLGRIGQPDDLPGAILFFASDDARFVTGQVLSVSGGLTMNG